MALVFDIETNGFLDECTELHCIVIRDLDKPKKAWCYHERRDFRPWSGTLEEGLRHLESAPMLVGHNIQGFDLPALKKLRDFDYKGIVRDTSVLSRLIYPEIKQKDFTLAAKRESFPKQFIGQHSLKAWGHRLGNLKTQVEGNDFSVFTQEMLDYCAQDVSTNVTVWQKQEQHIPRFGKSVEYEHRFAAVLEKVMQRGVHFNKTGAYALVEKLQKRRAHLDKEAVELCSGFVNKYTTPKKQLEREKFIPFNPGSRDHIARYLQEKCGWKPRQFTPSGKPQVDESILGSLKFPGAALFAERFVIQKRLGQLAEGSKAWLKQVKDDGRIYGRIIHNGAATGRCTHTGPNLAQVPAVRSPYGTECRGLFTATPGYTLVGADASGLELRMLAHYLAHHDDGQYSRVLLEEDIHTANQLAAGLQTRDQAKTFIYALLYGAGPGKIGEIIGKGKDAGLKIRSKFLKNIPALGMLLRGVKDTAREKGNLRGLDGRRLDIRSINAALNTLLQSAGAIVVKLWTIFMDELLTQAGLDAHIVLHVHDEFQTECRPRDTATVQRFAGEALKAAEDELGLRCALAGDTRVGLTWAETH